MAKNRKNQSAAIRFGPAVKAFLLCLLIGGAGVGYVWQKEQIARLDQQIAKEEILFRQLQDQNDKLRRQLAMMRSPQFLEMKVKELNLGLARPGQDQIWRLIEPPPSAGASEADRRLAAK